MEAHSVLRPGPSPLHTAVPPEREESPMRILDESFFSALSTGPLRPLLQRVKRDASLDLHLHRGEVDVYYRGAKLVTVGRRPGGYALAVQKTYVQERAPQLGEPVVVRHEAECESWLTRLPLLKDAIDLSLGWREREREALQLLVRENNTLVAGKASDYWVVDREYGTPAGQFDALALYWPSEGPKRRAQRPQGLALIEAKFGEEALDNDATGLAAYVHGARKLAPRFQDIATHAWDVFRQKHSLGLINHPGVPEVEHRLSGRLEVLLVLVDHDPDSSRLLEELRRVDTGGEVDVFMAQASNFGYALHRSRLVPLEDFRAQLEAAARPRARARPA
jgi:hypothetical protein